MIFAVDADTRHTPLMLMPCYDADATPRRDELITLSRYSVAADIFTLRYDAICCHAARYEML